MEYEEFTIEGRNAVIEAFRAGKTIDRLYILDGCQDGPIMTIKREAQKQNVMIKFVAKERLDQMSETGHHQGVIAQAAAYEYAEVEDILKRGKVPITCGGTGFWIQSIVDNIIYPQVKPDWELRKKLEKKSLENLLEELKKLDSARAATVDQKNKVRLIRAIEICRALGSVPDTKCKIPNTKYQFLQIGIAREKEELHQRIKLNVKNRLENGMIAEVEKLKESGLSWKKIESFGLSFRLIPQFIRKEIKNEEELAEKIYLAEKNYAKRQMTWFKKDKRIKWLNNYEDMEIDVEKFLYTR